MGSVFGREESSSSSDDDSESISRSEFVEAVTVNGYPEPNHLVYTCFKKDTRDFSREEAAMFLAQLIHESTGFQDREERDFESDDYESDLDLPGKSYHGRGYIQLTWAENYLAASKDLGRGDELLRNPEKVSATVAWSMLVSAWYWKNRVRPVLQDSNKFGLTTKAINGLLECNGEYNERAARRYQVYRKVAKELNIKNLATEDGCYKLKNEKLK